MVSLDTHWGMGDTCYGLLLYVPMSAHRQNHWGFLDCRRSHRRVWNWGWEATPHTVLSIQSLSGLAAVWGVALL